VADAHPKFDVSVVTPDGAVYQGEAEMLIVPGQACAQTGQQARTAVISRAPAQADQKVANAEVRKYRSALAREDPITFSNPKATRLPLARNDPEPRSGRVVVSVRQGAVTLNCHALLRALARALSPIRERECAPRLRVLSARKCAQETRKCARFRLSARRSSRVMS